MATVEAADQLRHEMVAHNDITLNQSSDAARESTETAPEPNPETATLASAERELEPKPSPELPPELWLAIVEILSSRNHLRSLANLVSACRNLYFLGSQPLYKRVLLPRADLTVNAYSDALDSKKWENTKQLGLAMSVEGNHNQRALDIVGQVLKKLERLSVSCSLSSRDANCLLAKLFAKDAIAESKLSYFNIRLSGFALYLFENVEALPSSLRELHVTLPDNSDPTPQSIARLYHALEKLLAASNVEVYLHGVELGFSSYSIATCKTLCRQLRQITFRQGSARTLALPPENGIEILDITNLDVCSSGMHLLGSFMRIMPSLKKVRMSLNKDAFFSLTRLYDTMREWTLARHLETLVILDPRFDPYVNAPDLDDLLLWRSTSPIKELVITISEEKLNRLNPFASDRLEQEVQKWKQLQGVRFVDHAMYLENSRWWPSADNLGVNAEEFTLLA